MKISMPAWQIGRGFLILLSTACMTLFGGCDNTSPSEDDDQMEVQRLTEACQGAESGMARTESCIALAKLRGDSRLELNGLGLEELPPSLFELHGLTWLLLNDNRLSSLPEAFGQLSELQVLSLRRNRFQSIPPAIFQLGGLTGWRF